MTYEEDVPGRTVREPGGLPLYAGFPDRSPEEVQADLALKHEELTQKKAETRKTLAEAHKAESEAEAYAMDLVVKKDLRLLSLAQDRWHHTYYFTEPVTSKSVEEAMSVLTAWGRMDPGADIEVILNSPGGSILAGVAFYDFLVDLRRRGHKLTITVQGIGASMAGVLLQAADERQMGAESWLLIHQGSLGAQGSFADVSDTVEWMKKVQERFLSIFVARSKMNRSFIKKNWERKDWWLDSDEALKLGLVDKVL